jgi:hypothetical protein
MLISFKGSASTINQIKIVVPDIGPDQYRESARVISVVMFKYDFPRDNLFYSDWWKQNPIYMLSDYNHCT